MSVLTLSDILEGISGRPAPQSEQIITAAIIDPEVAFPGTLFVHLEAGGANAAQRVMQAFQQGALLSIVAEELAGDFTTLKIGPDSDLQAVLDSGLPLCLQVPDPLAALHAIAGYWREKHAEIATTFISGGVGKTTTKDLVTEILRQRYRTLKNSGNRPSEIDVPLALIGLTGGHHRAVLEFDMSARSDQVARLAAPRLGILTNVSATFGEASSSQAELAHRMSSMVKILPPDGFAILNYDDPWVREMAEGIRARPFYYGLAPRADLWADEVVGMGLDGIRFRLHYRDETIHLRVPMIGRHSVHTALRAAAVGVLEGFTWQEIVQGLRLGNTQLRLVAVRTYHGALILDDTYNASLESSLAALNLLDEMEGRKIAVLGGQFSEFGRYQGNQVLGMRAAKIVDYLVTVGETGRALAAAARMAWLPASAIVEFDQVDQAIEHLDQILAADDIVLVKGPQDLGLDRIAAALERM